MKNGQNLGKFTKNRLKKRQEAQTIKKKKKKGV